MGGYIHEFAIGDGNCRSASFCYPFAACADPLNPGCFWIGEFASIRYCDGKTVSLVAGCADNGSADGACRDATFWHVHSLLATSDGRTLYVGEGVNRRLRSVDLKLQTVRTICGDGKYESRDGKFLVSVHSSHVL